MYATAFSLGTSRISLHTKIELAGGINLFLQRHGGAGGAWRVASLVSNSCSCCESKKDALTSLASFVTSMLPGTAKSSSRHSGVSHISALHWAQRPKSIISSSRGIFLPSSSEVSEDPHRKEATVSFSSGGSPKSEPLPWDPSSPGSILRLADWLGAGSSASLTWQHLLFHPSPLGLCRSLLLDLVLD